MKLHLVNGATGVPSFKGGVVGSQEVAEKLVASTQVYGREIPGRRGWRSLR